MAAVPSQPAAPQTRSQNICSPPPSSHLELLVLLLGILVPQLEVVLARILELDVLKLQKVLHEVLVHRVCEVDDLIVLGQQLFQEGALLQFTYCLSCRSTVQRETTLL